MTRLRPWQWALLLAAGLFLGWRIIALGTSRHYVGASAADGSADVALAWATGNAEAWILQARQAAPGAALPPDSLLARGLAANPTDGAALFSWSAWVAGADDLRAAAVDLALQLRPADVPLHLDAARYAIERGDLPTALAHWNAALVGRPQLGPELFPSLLAIAEDVNLRPQLSAIAAAPWWRSFFKYVAENAVTATTVRATFDVRRGAASVTADERGALVQRLQRDGLWGEAYVEWLNQLAPEQLRAAGPLFNGEFDWDPTQSGFDWRYVSDGNVKIDTAPTYGASGGKALHLVFRADHVPRVYVKQVLLLQPGRFRVTGRSRSDSLAGGEGLNWRVECAAGDYTVLARSERFIGLAQWQDFSLEFVVPAQDCPAQNLVLLAQGPARAVSQLRGELWFDALSVHRLGP